MPFNYFAPDQSDDIGELAGVFMPLNCFHLRLSVACTFIPERIIMDMISGR